jgi:hypothetical protein
MTYGWREHLGTKGTLMLRIVLKSIDFSSLRQMIKGSDLESAQEGIAKQRLHMDSKVTI